MTDIKYPDGVDCVWLASDRDGCLGAFVTGGVGPIPIQALNNGKLSIEETENVVHKLPKVSDSKLLLAVIKKLESFLVIAERGFFVYDWCDVHRTKRESINVYEPIAMPINPLKINALSKQLADLTANVKFHRTAFAHGLPLDVRVEMDCRESQESLRNGLI